MRAIVPIIGAKVFSSPVAMPNLDFTSRIREIQRARQSVLCVGLDPDVERLPEDLRKKYSLPDAVIAFNQQIIEATAPFASAFKLNLAFYEALGSEGWHVLSSTLDAMPEGVLTIADGKRGDIGNSARFYARATFEQLNFDSCTVSGYMGRDSVEPFLNFEGRGAFLLARTSNPGAADFQELRCNEERLFERVVRKALTWDEDRPGVVGFVVGATDLEALSTVRTIAPSVPLLIPGIGAQGGDAHAVMDLLETGSGPVLINSSRAIIYASAGPDFAESAGRAARATRDRLGTTAIR